MSKKVFDNYSKYYDLLYKDKDYAGESAYVYNTLKKYDPSIETLLEIGMGTGIHAKMLQDKGLSVTGIELSDSMAEKATEKGLECYVNNSSDFNLNRTFDAVISLFHVVSYLSGNKELFATFRNVNKHLKEEGIFLFDVWYSPAVYSLKPETRVKRLTGDDINITRIAEPEIDWNANVVNVNYDIFIEEISGAKRSQIKEKHPMRHFSFPEIDMLAEATGFSLLHAEEFQSGAIPSDKTWGVCFILKKK